MRKTRNNVVDSARAGAAQTSHSDAANAMEVRLWCIEDFRVMGRTERVKRKAELRKVALAPVPPKFAGEAAC